MEYYSGNLYRFKTICRLNLFKTIAFNLKMFDFKTAVKLPVFLYGNVDISGCRRGSIEFTFPVTRGGVFRFGECSDTLRGLYFYRNNRLCIKGRLILKGRVSILEGAVFNVAHGAFVTIGNGVMINSKSNLYCSKCIYIGDKTRISWECQIFDTSFHYYRDKDGNVNNCNGSIQIGDQCWIGNRTTISKGTNLPDCSIVASNSLVNKNFSNCNNGIIIGGMPAKVIKDGGCMRIFDVSLENEIDLFFKEKPNCNEINVNNF